MIIGMKIVMIYLSQNVHKSHRFRSNNNNDNNRIRIMNLSIGVPDLLHHFVGDANELPKLWGFHARLGEALRPSKKLG